MEEHRSQRAVEVARDLFGRLESELRGRNAGRLPRSFELADTDVILSEQEAVNWIRESVDQGFPEIRYVIKRVSDDGVLVDLAAFEDPDSQYHP
ncbi:MAG TPA: hypothetical protein VE110_02770 [Gemmatimonadaceae bacterium]|nr:hypothetical protein [Gemmatimonadaceae bacterium]